ncbi:ImmA/IrrE family metallo-endopeptidase [Streptomyces aculeolatus]
MNWDTAHRIAMLAASRAHRDYQVPTSEYVDVFAAMKAAGLTVMAKPMPRLFGFYFAPKDRGPAALVNASLDEVTLRHTAAHELGHHVLEHGSRADEDLAERGQWGSGHWPEEEKTAEAFASWFLMPRAAVRGALAAVGVRQPETPDHAYQLARWLGTSYAGTVNHLPRLRLVSRTTAKQWLQVPPARIRAHLCGTSRPLTKGHVFPLTAAARGKELHVEAGDIIVLPGHAGPVHPLPHGLRGRLPEPAVPGHAHSTIEVTDNLVQPATLALASADPAHVLTVTLSPAPTRDGLQSAWSH